MEVPFLDVAAANRELADALTAAAGRVITSERLILGPELDRFEQDFAAYLGARECVGVGSGLDALALGLRALGVEPGDEVIVPSHTFAATWLAVTQIGAVPVPVEPDPATHGIDPERIPAAITPRTRAILPVHMYGQPVDLAPVMALAEAHGLVVLDDAAQAHGARYRGRRIGALAHASAWSFYPGKNLGAIGDGGAVTTPDPAIATRVRSLRNYGSSEKYVHDEQGANSRLDELQAALLSVKLSRLDDWNARRARIAERYRSELRDCDIVLPGAVDWADPAWHLFVVRSPERDRLQAQLAAAGVQTLIHYPIPPHRQRAFAETTAARVPAPLAEQLAAEVLSLPIGPHLTEAQQDHVIAAVRDCA
jgi:dTDP-3-amino-3,4,6-trideoxy-alpha-D-glucose transaminase